MSKIPKDELAKRILDLKGLDGSLTEVYYDLSALERVCGESEEHELWVWKLMYEAASAQVQLLEQVVAHTIEDPQLGRHVLAEIQRFDSPPPEADPQHVESDDAEDGTGEEAEAGTCSVN